MSEITQTLEKKDELKRRRKNRASLITFFTFGITFITSAYFTYMGIKENVQWSIRSVNILSAVVALSSLIAIWFIRRDKTTIGALILQLSFAYAIVVSVLFYGGMDIILGMLSLVVFLGISSTTLPQGTARQAGVGITVFVVSSIVLISFIEPFEREFFSPDPLTLVLSLLLFLLFGMSVSQEFPYYPVRTKFVIALIFLSALGIGIAFTVENLQIRETLEQDTREILLSKASAKAVEVESFLRYNIDLLNTAASYLDFRAYLLLDEEERHGTEIERRIQNFLFTLKNKNINTLSYGLLDTNGKNIADSNSLTVGTDESAYNYFHRPFNSGSSYVSSPLYLPNDKNAIIYISVPVHNDMGDVIGVLRVKYKASALQDLLSEDANLNEAGIFSVLFDENHIIIAHGYNEDLVGKIVYNPTTLELKNMKEQYLFPSALGIEEIAYNFPEVQAGLDNVGQSPYFFTPTSRIGGAVIGAIVQLNDKDSPPWLLVTAQPQSTFIQRAQAQTQRGLIFSLILIGLAALVGLFISNMIVAPILKLKNTTQEFTEGSLNARAEIETDDEVGELAAAFNNLADQLGETVTTLEDQVKERTQALALRSAYLERASKVSRIATSLTDTGELSRKVVNLIQQEFNLYYVGLFLIDENEEWAILKAGTGEAGRTMLALNHRLKLGEGMIGWTAKYGEARIALDVGEDAVRFDNPVLPETRSEGALPLRARGRVLGALSIQSAQPEAFTPEIISTLQIMADQIAVAFENAELFARREAALQAERIAYGQLSEEDWNNLLNTKQIPNYIANAKNQIKTKIYQSEEKKNIQDRPILENQGLTAVIPIKVRGRTLGGIKLQKPKQSGTWTKDQVELAETLANEVSIALENARLFDQSQRRAAQEHVVGQAATRMRERLDINYVLQVATEELHKALGQVETEVWIAPQKKPNTEKETTEKETKQ